ncbi:hypothetical protein [Micromonospora taraxaci]|uniref:hypothetical protein n=1 Tax=Micromonospora taraxaci TaxID=1316803 RepID=UPI00340FE146
MPTDAGPGRPRSTVATWTRDDIVLGPAPTVGVFAAFSIVEVFLFANRPGERQHAGKARSESTKSLTWRLAIIAHPFPDREATRNVSENSPAASRADLAPPSSGLGTGDLDVVRAGHHALHGRAAHVAEAPPGHARRPLRSHRDLALPLPRTGPPPGRRCGPDQGAGHPLPGHGTVPERLAVATHRRSWTCWTTLGGPRST